MVIQHLLILLRHLSSATIKGLAGEWFIGKYPKRIYFVICILMEPQQVGRDENVTVVSAKIEIRCGLFAVSPQENIACS